MVLGMGHIFILPSLEHYLDLSPGKGERHKNSRSSSPAPDPCTKYIIDYFFFQEVTLNLWRCTCVIDCFIFFVAWHLYSHSLPRI